MAVSVKMGVDVSGFRTGIQQAQNSVRTLDAELKKNEAQFKATGNSEQYMADKSKLLNQKLGEQKKVVDETQKALKAMTDAGIKPTDKAYQDMERTLLNAQTAMYTTQAAMNEMGTSAANACKGADQLTQSVNNIGKKVSLDAVIGGINTITSGLENAAKKAVDVGKAIWDNIMDTAARADDIATMAQTTGLTIDQIQRMEAVANEFEAPVAEMAKVWKTVKLKMTSDSADVEEAFRKVGVATTEMVDTGFGKVPRTKMLFSNYMDVFWKTGESLMNMKDAAEQERLANTLLGKSWSELKPLFAAGREAYEGAMANVTVASDEAINNAADLNAKVAELEYSFQTLKTEVIGDIAPALTAAADTLKGLVDSVTEYLQTPEGKQMLEDLGTAVSGLFEDLSKIDPEAVVSGFVKVFDTIISSLQWMVENKSTLEGILAGIVTAWGLVKIGGGALKVYELVTGLRALGGAAGVEKAIQRIANSNTPVAAAPGTEGGAAAGSAVWAKGASSAVESALTGALGGGLLTKAGIGVANTVTSPLGAFGIAAASLTPIVLQLISDARKNAEMADLYGSEFTDARLTVKGMIKAGLAPDTANTFADIKHSMNETTWYGKILNFFNDIPKNVSDAFSDSADKVAEAAENIADAIQKKADQINSIHFGGGGGGGTPMYEYGLGTFRPYMRPGGYANGLPDVPYDGFLSILHKGERVMPAREVASRNFSSNLYVENMNMNGGLSADALAAAIAGRNRRMMAGYGS